MKFCIRSVFAILVLVAFVAGCSLTYEAQCRHWKNSGAQMGTIDSCVQCMDTLGSYNQDAVVGCSLGLDAAELMKPPEPRSNEPRSNIAPLSSGSTSNQRR